MLLALLSIINLLLNVLWWMIIIQVVLSWLVAFNVLNTQSQGLRAFLAALDRISEPIYRPIRKVLPDFGGIDFSPFVLLILIQVLQMLLAGVAADIAFPAITIARDGSISAIDSLAKLTKASTHALRKDYFAGLIIIDASGLAHHVRKAVPVLDGSPLQKLMRRLLNRCVEVGILIARTERISLVDLKLRVIGSIRAHKEFWEAGGSTSDLERTVDQAESHHAIVAIFK